MRLTLQHALTVGQTARAEGELLGAVGMSGDNSDNDEICALAGIGSIGLTVDAGA